MFKVILTLITIVDPSYAYKLQNIQHETVVLTSTQLHDAVNICRRIGDQFVKNTPSVKDKHGYTKYARVYTCNGGSQLEYWLDESVKDYQK